MKRREGVDPMNRAFLGRRKRLAFAVTTALLALGVMAGTASAVTKTFSNPSQIDIPDDAHAVPYPSTISVSGFAGNVQKVTATLNGLQHSYLDDVAILLVGPNGTNSILAGHVGGNEGVFAPPINITFDQASLNTLNTSDEAVTGTYRPSVEQGDRPPTRLERREPFKTERACQGPFGPDLSRRRARSEQEEAAFPGCGLWLRGRLGHGILGLRRLGLRRVGLGLGGGSWLGRLRGRGLGERAGRRLGHPLEGPLLGRCEFVEDGVEPALELGRLGGVLGLDADVRPPALLGQLDLDPRIAALAGRLPAQDRLGPSLVDGHLGGSPEEGAHQPLHTLGLVDQLPELGLRLDQGAARCLHARPFRALRGGSCR
jgi:hypothetical protein